METWDLYDRNRQLTGQTMTRGEPIPEGAYHLFVNICLFNHRGELLIQRRQPDKREWPGLWDLSACGSAVSGENSAAAATRELREELGLVRCFRGVRPHLCVSWDQGFGDVYVLTEELDPAGLHLQPEEVAAVRWACREEVLALLAAGDFVPYYDSFLRLLFDFRQGYGCGCPRN